jgi:hypothetical protein
VKGGRMWKLYLLVVFMLLLYPVISFAELPMAIYNEYCPNVVQDSAALHDTLGINYVYGNVQYDCVQDLGDAGFGLIKWGGDNHLVNKLSGESYFVVSAANTTTFPKFEYRRGHADTSGEFWVSDSAGVKLSGTILDYFWIQQYALSSDSEEQGPRQFFAKMRMAIDTAGIDIGDSIGTIFVHRMVIDTLGDTTWQQRAAIPILVDNSLKTGDTIFAPSDPPYFTLGGLSDNLVYHIKYSFRSSGKPTVYLDSLKCYNLTGLAVMNGLYDQDIADSVTISPWDQVDQRWLRDEPKYDHFPTNKQGAAGDA